MDWKDIVRKVAPALGTAAGGPWGGMATKFLADKFLGKPDATEDELATAIMGATPEQLVQIKNLDQQFKIELKKLGIKEAELGVGDRKSARALFQTNIWPQIVLSVFFVIGYFVVLWAVLTSQIEMNEGLKAIAFTLIGVMSAEVTRIMAFWFGSSMGSKEKTQKLQLS